MTRFFDKKNYMPIQGWVESRAVNKSLFVRLPFPRFGQKYHILKMARPVAKILPKPHILLGIELFLFV